LDLSIYWQHKQRCRNRDAEPKGFHAVPPQRVFRPNEVQLESFRWGRDEPN
jgi:hypothetical protein